MVVLQIVVRSFHVWSFETSFVFLRREATKETTDNDFRMPEA
jgi:hypothetical protein